MTHATTIPDTITLHVPFRVVKRGGRKEMVLPPGASTQRARVENTLVKALARVLRLTLLAPDIVEAILDGRQGPEMTLARLLDPFPVEWQQQHQHFR